MRTSSRVYSRIAEQAILLMGSQIELARKDRRMSETELAKRIGVSRGTVQRMEKGHPGVEIATVFEAATVLSVPLFSEDRKQTALEPHVERTLSLIALMPKRARRRRVEVNDDF